MHGSYGTMWKVHRGKSVARTTLGRVIWSQLWLAQWWGSETRCCGNTGQERLKRGE